MVERAIHSRADLASLRERVEKLTWPDRETDAALSVAFCEEAGARMPTADEYHDYDKGDPELGDYWIGDRLYCAGPLTSSLDAALDFVEQVLPKRWPAFLRIALMQLFPGDGPEKLPRLVILSCLRALEAEATV